MEENLLINDIKNWAKITSGKQLQYFNQMLKDAKVIKVVPISEVMSKEDIDFIKRTIKPKSKMCYKNSHLLTLYFPEALYVEGKVTVLNSFGIDHAFNKIGDKYIDITMELALKKDITKEEYISLGEYDFETIRRITTRTEVFGNIYNELYLENIKQK